MATPVYTAEGDTEETRVQADRENAKWLALCAADDDPFFRAGGVGGGRGAPPAP